VSGEAVALAAHAKLNLFLRVLSREADGYHGIETLFCLVDLADTLGSVLGQDLVTAILQANDQHAGDELEEGVEGRDPLAACVAFPSEEHPSEHGHVVPVPDLGAAVRAA
jgi:hypothetical protein